MGDIVVSSHWVEPPNKAEIQIMRKRLAEARNELPRQLRMVPLDQSLIDLPSKVIDRLRLEMAYQKALCILYHRFLGQRKLEEEHRSCILAAETIVRYSISMLEAAQPGGQLAPVKIMLVRHIHEFNLAAMILCSELKRSASSRKSGPPQSIMDPNTQPMLLQACHLWNTPDIPSPKAQVALDAMISFLEASDIQNTQSEKDGFNTEVLTEEQESGESHLTMPPINSCPHYDSTALFEISDDGHLDMSFEGYDSVFSNLFEQTSAGSWELNGLSQAT